MFKIVFAAFWLLPAIVFGMQAPQPAPMTVEHIGGGLYLVKGGPGANAAFYIGEKSVTAIDAKMTAEAAEEMLAKIAEATNKPVTAVLLTHSDRDHVDGLIGFPAGMKIIASENTKKEMAEASVPYLPGQTYSGSMTFDAGGEILVLRQLGPAHTSGDTMIVFPAEKAAFVGDLAFVGRDPLIHRAKGGTVFGYLAALRTMIGLEGVDTYLSGHADPLTKDDLKTLLATLEDKVGKVKELFASGKTLEEVKAALLPAPSPGTPPSRWPSFIENVYLELAERK